MELSSDQSTSSEYGYSQWLNMHSLGNMTLEL